MKVDFERERQWWDAKASREEEELRDEAINRAQQVILGNMIFQRELVEECRLRFLPRSHHRQSLPTG